MKSSAVRVSSLRPGAGPRHCVGDLLIDIGRQRVTRRDEVIALPKLSFDLLIALMRAAPDLISGEALLEEVWPKTVVSPETLNQRVKLLRDALGAARRNPRYIAGVRGRGDRLVPPVEALGAPAPAVAREHAAAIHRDAGATERACAVTSEAAAGAGEPALVGPAGDSKRRLRLPKSATWLAVATGVVLLALIAVVLAWWRLRPKPVARPPRSADVVAVLPWTVAVLPFENLSPAAHDNYLALGFAESVRRELAGVPQLIVLAPSSSFALGRPTPDAREIGRRLGVRYIVEGNVQRAGDMLRVTAYLIDTQTSHELWSIKLDRSINALFQLQDQIAEQVARELAVTLHGSLSDYAQHGAAASLAFLKGRALVDSRRISDVDAAVRHRQRLSRSRWVQRQALAQMRLMGTVPIRSGGASTPAGW